MKVMIVVFNPTHVVPPRLAGKAVHLILESLKPNLEVGSIIRSLEEHMCFPWNWDDLHCKSGRSF